MSFTVLIPLEEFRVMLIIITMTQFFQEEISSQFRNTQACCLDSIASWNIFTDIQACNNLMTAKYSLVHCETSCSLVQGVTRAFHQNMNELAFLLMRHTLHVVIVLHYFTLMHNV